MSNEAPNIRRASGASHELTREPDFNAPVKPISEFVDRPDFPECTVGEHVDIGGYTGVVVAIVRQSMRVRSAEGNTQGFNSYTLRRLYGRPPEPEIVGPTTSSPVAPAEPAEPPRDVVAEPNFDQPIVPISNLIGGPAFPKSALGKHVDISGYTGVVVEILNDSLKVRSPQGTSRNYNIPILKKLHGPGDQASRT